MSLDYAHQLTDQELAALENRIAAEYKKATAELTEKINAYFDSFKKRDAETKALIGTIVNGREYTEKDYRQWRLAQIGRGKRFEALRDRIAERMTHANETAAAYINDTTPGLYSLNRNYAAYTIEQQVGADVGFDLWDEQTVKRLLVEQPDLMPYYPPERAVKRGIDLAWGKRQITAQVTSGILQGEPIKKLADRLQANIPDMNRDSAIRAARTAVTGAQNAGRQDSYDAAVKMGIEMEKQWIATLDGRTRHAHAAADGQTAEEDKPFSVGGEELMYPGDPRGSGWNIYNCRCTMIAKVKGVDMSSALRRARDPETGESVVIENMTYAQWAGWKESRKTVAKPSNSGIIEENNPREIPAVRKPADFRKTVTPEDVTEEYTRAAMPGRGTVTREEGYRTKGHHAEIAMAQWLHSRFGGDILLLTESEIKGQVCPDFRWNGRLWELKAASTINSADKLLQHAIKQIQDNPGGVILNLGENMDMAALEKQLASRIHRSKIEALDLMILEKAEMIKVLRYRK